MWTACESACCLPCHAASTARNKMIDSDVCADNPHVLVFGILTQGTCQHLVDDGGGGLLRAAYLYDIYAGFNITVKGFESVIW